MKLLSAIAVSLFSIATMASAAVPTKTPILLELFTSEGCSSCPPADLLFSELLEAQPFDGIELIGIAQHVDYWNQLGWRDRFSSPVFSERQRRYSRQLANDNRVYTPQIVVHGKLGEVGSRPEKVFDAIDHMRSELQRNPPLDLPFTMERKGSEVRVVVHSAAVAELKDGDKTLTIAVVQDGLTSRVQAGENVGRNLAHDAVALAFRQRAILPEQSISETLSFTAEMGGGPLRVVVLAQEHQTGRVVALAQQPLPPS